MNTTFERSINSKHEWLTPEPMVRALGPFDLDPCAPICRPWPTAKHHFTIADDGLNKAWRGYVWLNPPYGKLAPMFMSRLAAHGNGIALIPARTDTRMFFESVWPKAEAIKFLKGRIHFYEFVCQCGAPHSAHKPEFECQNYRSSGAVIEGGQGGTPPVLVAYGAQAAARLYDSELEGKLIALRFVAEIQTTWRRLIRFMLKQANGVCRLEELYEIVKDHPKAASNPNWKAKVRQVVQMECQRISPGTWRLTIAW